MKKNGKMYGNLFESKKITPARLCNFAQEVLTRLETMENTPLYNEYYNQVSSATQQLDKTVTDIDSTLNHRSKRIEDRNAFVTKFKVTMRKKEEQIADLLGGDDKEGFAAFYPNGTNEYSKANLEQMPLLVNRIKNEAATYADKLGDGLVTLLQSFKPGWDEAFNTIGTYNKTIEDSRAARDLQKDALENILSDFMRAVGKSAGGAKQFKSFFNFSLLYPPPADKKKPTPVVPMPTEQKPAVNQ